MPKGILNQSNEFRKLIFHQADKYNISIMHVCYRVGVDYKTFLRSYANVKDLPNTEVSLADYVLVEIANILGINVRSVFVVRDEYKFEEESKELKEKLKYEYINKKKGAAPEAK